MFSATGLLAKRRPFAEKWTSPPLAPRARERLRPMKAAHRQRMPPGGGAERALLYRFARDPSHSYPGDYDV